MIPQITIDRIIDSANIVDVVSEYVTLRRAGANYKGLCPFHDDKTPSFHVSPSKGICKCFACGEGGNAVQFIMKMEQLSYVEALKHLGKRYGIEIEERELTDEDRQIRNERESMFALNEWASNYYHDLLYNHPDGKSVGLAYFRSRGFRDDIIHKFRLGFALDSWDALSKEATKKGYKEQYLVNDPATRVGTGLSIKRDNGSLIDKYRGRVMFPWFNRGGKIVAFGGRVLDSRTKGVSQKYINSSESLIYSKGHELYGLYQAKRSIDKENRVYMVEGYTDVLSMHQCGIENVVANSGTALSEAQIRLLRRFTNNITLLYDGDEAGIHAALRGTDMLLAESMNVKILLLPDGDDPDSFARKHSATEFKEYVEAHQTDFIVFKTNLLLKEAGRDPIKRAELTKDIVNSISVIPEEIVRQAYIHECSELLDVDEAVLLRETQKNRKLALEELEKEKQRALDRARYLAQREAEQALTAGVTVPTSAQPTDGGTKTQQPTSNPSDAGMSPEEIEALEAMYADMPPELGGIPTSQPSGTTNKPQEPSNGQLGTKTVTGGYSANSLTTKEESRFIGLERMIMTLVVRQGNTMISMLDEEGQTVEISLLEYVGNEMETDGLQFHSPLYASMLHDCMEHIQEGEFDVTRFFVNNQRLDYSTEAVNLLTEKYQLSKKQAEQMASEEELAPGYIQHLMLDYKNQVIEDELKRCQKLLSNPKISADPVQCNAIMQKFMQYNNIKRALAKELGDRVLLK